MSVAEIGGYIASLFIGISLGLIGGGGSILTVPVLVYLFGAAPLLATSYSLFIVGSASLIGAINNYNKGTISIKTALIFGLSSTVMVFLIRKLVIPAIPKTIVTIGGTTITESFLTMILFAMLMIFASVAMIRDNNTGKPVKSSDTKTNLPILVFYGIGVGVITGFLGAGGGFILIPTLVLMVGLPMKKAVGTSLLIIALNALIGFTGDFDHFAIDWPFLIKITFIAIAGILVGHYLSKKISGQRLKKAFGWFVLIMGLYIILKETVL